MAGTDEDDPVVHEMPVFLSKSLAEKLYIFQYPLRPESVTYDDVNYLRARLKPIQKKVEVELALDTRGSTYDKSQGELIASVVDGPNTKEEDRYFQSNTMDKQVMTSTLAVPSTSRYAVGCFADGELHVNPIHGVVQLRPTFTYLDKSDAKQSKDKDSTEPGSNVEEEELAQQVTVKFARPDNDKFKKAREKSFRFHQQTLDDEPWVDVAFHTNDTEWSKLTRKNLMCHHGQDHVITDLHVLNKDYLLNLVPDVTDVDGNKTQTATDALSLSQLKSFPLGDQIKSVLLNAKVIAFSELLSLLPQKTDPGSVLRLVQQVAVLVLGNWVVKSEQLHPKKVGNSEKDKAANALIDVMNRGRDYILWHFTKGSCVNRKEMATATKLSSDILKEILEQIARYHTNKGWEFMLPVDKEFIDKHPEVVQRQQMIWESNFKQIVKDLKLVKESTEKTITSPKLRSPRQRRRTKSQRESDTENSGSENSRVTDINTADNAVDIKRIKTEPIDTFTNGETNEYVGSEFVPSKEVFGELVTFVKEKMRVHWCISISELRRLLTQKLAESPPGHILSCGISDVVLTQAAEASGASIVKTMWPADRPEELLFAMVTMNDSWDTWRKVLFNMYKTNSKYRKATIRKRIEEETKKSTDDTELAKFLKNYCVSNRSGMYYLKGTFLPGS